VILGNQGSGTDQSIRTPIQINTQELIQKVLSEFDSSVPDDRELTVFDSNDDRKDFSKTLTRLSEDYPYKLFKIFVDILRFSSFIGWEGRLYYVETLFYGYKESAGADDDILFQEDILLKLLMILEASNNSFMARYYLSVLYGEFYGNIPFFNIFVEKIIERKGDIIRWFGFARDFNREISDFIFIETILAYRGDEKISDRNNRDFVLSFYHQEKEFSFDKFLKLLLKHGVDELHHLWYSSMFPVQKFNELLAQ